MASPSDRAVKRNGEDTALLRQIPSVDEVLNRPTIAALRQQAGRELTVEITRRVLTNLRARAVSEPAPAAMNIADIEIEIARQMEQEMAPSLRAVINATGVVLHTNLGRAPIGKSAAERLAATATRYSNLEYDLADGMRGQRDVHTNTLLAELLGAEAAIVVNNNAAAVFLVLNTLAKGAEVIVSRGELIEIGDGFRIPDIMAESGAELREVGTTNRTRIADYERAVTERTRLLLRVHPSNFRMVGFTKRPGLDEIVELGQRRGLMVFEDLGSGCLADLSSAGIDEPLARKSFEAGANVVTFSGDKLLGGPQAGIIAGKKEIVERIRRNPLFRALRVDKLTIAVLEATLRAYRRGAFEEIPALAMIRMTSVEIGRRAAAFAARLKDKLPQGATFEIREGSSVIGGGSTPDQKLPTSLIGVASNRYSAVQMEERLRRPIQGTPVIARIEEDRLLLDLRTVFVEEETSLADALLTALR
ncbi:MAG TPA: L-seryl-tRNA(Sec) selenium transferase [Candidatus Limnocylindrales bacterium]|nr:L-seryl-tRNA(Sec) selenium transferase [Candidatus Limnocylindrales bacterium]